MTRTPGHAYQAITADGAALPLLSPAADSVPIAWWGGRAIDRGTFLAHLRRVANCLPSMSYVVNLCQDRYLFLVAFAAAGLAGKTCLLPSSRVKAACDETVEAFLNSFSVDDLQVSGWLNGEGDRVGESTIPWLARDQEMAIAFTSGSTGHAQPHPKTWGELHAGAWLAGRRFGFALKPGTTIVATVPPQHMYGLETSIMLPLTMPVALHAGRPLFPSDVIATLASVPAPRVLITTPAHLRVFAGFGGDWPALALVISATAPLSRELATAAEAALAAPIMEIYGFTEAGSVASRRTVDGDSWMPYDGIGIKGDWLHAAHLPAPVRLPDLVDVGTDGRFCLSGRRQDMVNVAGKRTSLSYLNRALTEITGIEDGAFVVPDQRRDGRFDLAALVVAPTLTRGEILNALAQRLDPLFLPRPLVLSDRMPRNDVGKLTREAVLDVVRAVTKRSGGGD
ncbi:MAG: acyl-CoA synthetase [Rhodospirillales bacterium]|nr:acyl-CoA synthetase [Rhodospirillales bacterium]